MEEKESKEYCLKDYTNRHCFLSIGVFSEGYIGEVIQVFKCSQCNKVILEKLEVIQ